MASVAGPTKRASLRNEPSAESRNTRICPPAPASLFFRLASHTSKKQNTGPKSTVDSRETVGPLSPTPTPYDSAIARIEGLHSHLNPSMRSSLKSLLTLIHTQLLPGTGVVPHQLILQIASPDTPDEELLNMANIIDAGLVAFLARGGRPVSSAPVKPPTSDLPTPPESAAITAPTASDPERSSTKASTTRSQRVTRGCMERDLARCQLTNQSFDCIVSHIIPFSVRQSKGVDFWKFIELFRGETETRALRVATLGDEDSTDVLTNVWFINVAAHGPFDRGNIAVLPIISDAMAAYDPSTVSEYYANVEFPFGRGRILLPLADPDHDPDEDEVSMRILKGGDIVVFKTSNPKRLPLPHPLLFQLHAICARVLAMKASAGFMMQPPSHDPEHVAFGYYASEEATDLDEGESETASLPRFDTVAHWPHDELTACAPSSLSSGRSSEREADSGLWDNEMPRFVSVVGKEFNARMGNMWRLCSEKLGRQPQGGRWWEGGESLS